ncbi:MAG: hypothetical protein ACOCUU_01750 [Nanoarchaeota archaeon]
MKLYILPGNHISNKEWARDLKNSLINNFKKIEMIEYLHWTNNKDIMDLDHEVEHLKIIMNDEKEFGIIAKSLGCILTLKAIKEKKISPKFIVLLGIPIEWCKENGIEIEKYIKEFSCPTLLFHNKGDPTISSDELFEYLEKRKINNYNLIKLDNNTHDYINFSKMKEGINNFLESFD